MRASHVEQVFVRRRGGRVEVSFVFEDPAGGRTRESLATPMASAADALRYAATWLARRGLRVGPRLRLRVERGSELLDDAALRSTFLAACRSESAGALTRGEGATWPRD